jgi:dolichol-phosphate mannosyltransferase
MGKLISFVIPTYNEEAGIKKFYGEMLAPVLEKLSLDYEVIFVNDGSKDKTLDQLYEIAEENPKVRVLAFSRNFGKEAALTAGIRQAKGDAVMSMDADGQQPPDMIPEFIEKWEGGERIVTGVRNKFDEHGLIPRMGSALFYKLLKWMGAGRTVPGETDFRLMDRSVVDEFCKLTEHDRITRGLVDWMGFDQLYVKYDYGNRLAGKPSYNFEKLTKLAIDSFVSLSTTPLVVFGYIGGIITVFSTILGLFTIIQQHILGDPLNLRWNGATQLAIFITFLVGLVLISQAIAALYISHIHNESKNRPLYFIDNKKSKNL